MFKTVGEFVVTPEPFTISYECVVQLIRASSIPLGYGKIFAIKALREQFPALGLADARGIVEVVAKQLGFYPREV